jgi:hypothetical protein
MLRKSVLLLRCCLVASQFGAKEGEDGKLADFACNNALAEQNKILNDRVKMLEAQLNLQHAENTGISTTEGANTSAEKPRKRRIVKVLPSWSKASNDQADQSIERANAAFSGCSWETMAPIDLAKYGACSELAVTASKPPEDPEEEGRLKDSNAVHVDADRTPLALEVALCEGEKALKQWMDQTLQQGAGGNR